MKPHPDTLIAQALLAGLPLGREMPASA